MNIGELGTIAAELMEMLEEEYGDKDDIQVGVVSVVAELNFTENGEEWTDVRYRCSDARRWVQAGLFRTCQRVAEGE